MANWPQFEQGITDGVAIRILLTPASVPRGRVRMRTPTAGKQRALVLAWNRKKASANNPSAMATEGDGPDSQLAEVRREVVRRLSI